MAAQAALVAETIAGMNHALARDQDSSESDEPYLQPSNRGNKLKRKAHDVLAGHSGRPNGPKIYKRSVEHAGYHRDILRRNPKRYDEDGDELADSDADEDADARAAEENPYAGIHLENLLMPLTSPAKLPKHPSLSIAYTSPVLTNMAQHACEMVQRERKTLANAKRLMTKLRGDETWLPCELMYSQTDEAIFSTEKLYNRLADSISTPRKNGIAAQSLLNGTKDGASPPESSPSGTELGSASYTINGTIEEFAMESNDGLEQPNANGVTSTVICSEVRAMENHDNSATKRSEMEMETETIDSKASGCAAPDGVLEIAETRTIAVERETEDATNRMTLALDELGPELRMGPGVEEPTIKGESVNADINLTRTQNDKIVSSGLEPELAAGNDSTNHSEVPNAGQGREEEGMDGLEGPDTIRPEPRRMRTRAQAHAASEPTASSRTESPDSYVAPEIHPLFKMPRSAIPDKDFGLPPNEADETRRLLTMYVQKQEEVCRGAETLYEGLLRADRQRTTVLKWCKAEDHVGEMSDGEDWYDKEEWGLEEDLEKGHNDEEGETNAIQGRKPRRRA